MSEQIGQKKTAKEAGETEVRQDGKFRNFRKSIAAKAAERKRKIRRELELKRLKRIRRRQVPAYRYCKNCGTELQGMYCHNCGQYALDTEQPFWKYILQYFENVYQFDGKIWATLWMLLRRPGFLTTEFNAGKIASYVHPMRMLMFITVLFFLFFFTFVGNKFHRAFDETNYRLIKDIHDEEDIRLASKLQKDTCIAIIADSLEMAKYDGVIDMIACSKGSVKKKDTMLVKMPSIYIGDMIIKENGTWQGHALFEKSLPEDVFNNNNKLFVERVLGTASSYAPILALLLTPVFALIFRRTYRKCKMPYMNHFVFALHLTSFFYIILALYIAVGEMWKYSGLPFYFFGTVMLVYIALASHHLYNGVSWYKIILKTLWVAFKYLVLLSIIMIALSIWLIYSEGNTLIFND